MNCTCRKAIFTSRNEAADMMRRTGNRGHPYVCPCDPDLWHLGTMSKQARRAERRRRRELAER